MESIAYAITGGWASGISAYATVLLLGLFGRADLVDVPATLQRTDVLVVVGVLTAIEFVADKVPYIDSVWDSVHTVIRPLVAAALGVLAAGDASTLAQAGLGTLSGGLALASHGAKAGVRLAVNTSPEPLTNIGISSAEEISLAGVLLLATQYPWAAAAVALILLITGISLAVWLARRIRAGWRRIRLRLPPTPPPEREDPTA